MTPANDTRERLLAAGEELVGRKGFHGCGLSEILAHAGVPKGSFYHYFGSKEEFGVALIERTRDGYEAVVKPILADRRLSPMQRLRGIFEAAREDWQTCGQNRACLISKVALDAGDLSEPVHAAVKCAFQQWSALLAQVLREAQAAGEIDRKHDPDRLGNVLVMLWEGAAMRMLIDRNLTAVDDFLAFVFESLLAPGVRS
ncbi:MAG: TetR/AcrR family transcriptional regulator [Planctomycetes bacterium]|jgi:TetR/AcrR family transcriptional repressor of nem operon|nr:TetR/AcrR family transcriptional regulator [Planctomycetota bacterium]